MSKDVQAETMTDAGATTVDPDVLIAGQLDRPPDDAVRTMGMKLSARAGVAAVLFYGNRLRDSGAEGLLDFYVLTDSDRAYHGTNLSAAFNRLLPPNVYFEETAMDGKPITAKVAVISLSAFRRRMRKMSWDTTLWARFCQPVLLVHTRDDAARKTVTAAIACAYRTAAWWALALSSDENAPDETWRTLFEHTYGAELRVESANRAQTIVETTPELYAALHRHFIAPIRMTAKERRMARTAWSRRRGIGKFLNAARLVKAAATFRGGIPYILSKVERHSGRPVELSRWQRRLPWLAAPFVFLRLLIERRLR